MATIEQKIKQLTQLYDLKPHKQKGQHFLISVEPVLAAVKAANVDATDTVLEIGPGLGLLTEALSQRAKQVIAVELDERLAGFLQTQFVGAQNVKVVREDFLRFDLQKLSTPYKVVANLPYNITSKILQKILTTESKPTVAVVMIQKEVGERICAAAGEMSAISVMVQLYGQPKIIQTILPREFYPAPKVTSVILKIDQIEPNEAIAKRLAPVGEREFWSIIHIGFSARRKKLHNNLSAGLRIGAEASKGLLERAGIDPNTRAQNLTVDDWITLAKIIKS